MPKLILAVVLIVCVGAVVGLMGWVTTKRTERIVELEEAIKTKSLPINNKEIDIFKFIPEHSVIVQKKTEDIDNDNIKEIFLYYITDFKKDSLNLDESITFGSANLKILKSKEDNNYERAWSYTYPKLLVYDESREKSNNCIIIYDKETEIPKIGFVINHQTNPLLNSYVFVYFDKKRFIDFNTIRILHKGPKSLVTSNSIDNVEIKDIDGDGTCEIIKTTSSKKQEYKWNKENYSYKYQSEEPLLSFSEKIYRSEKFGYEFKYPSYINPSDINIFEKDEKLIISYGHGLATIYAPKKVKSEEIEKYRCIEEEGKSACSKIQSENEFNIFKFTHGAVSHWDSSSQTYSLIKENEDESFLVIEIGTQGINVDETAASLKMIR
ncbi:MAG: hypothetical protein DRG30_00395 [Epsilonproteobacteria bacterium]|nr:MAG: hypothetical protein DRG30_00395 [Campylobacterota bacterium]